MRAHAFFGGGEQIHCLKPDMERDFRPLHNGTDRDGELLAAGIALETAGAMFLAEHPGYAFAEGAAMRALRAIWPDAFLEQMDVPSET